MCRPCPATRRPAGPHGRFAAEIAPSADDLEEGRRADPAPSVRPSCLATAPSMCGTRSSRLPKDRRPGADHLQGQGPHSGHPSLAAGVLGRSGTPIASWFMNEADLIVSLGSSFSNHTGIAPYKPIIQVDFERMQLGKFHPVTLPVWGEIGPSATLCWDRFNGRRMPDQIAELAERWAIWREEKESAAFGRAATGHHSAAIFKALTEPVPGGCDHSGRCRQQHLFLRPVFRATWPADPDVRLSRLDRLRSAGSHGRLVRHAGL
jgi:pyruvate oxidase